MRARWGIFLVTGLFGHAVLAWAGQTWHLSETDVVHRILQSHLGIQAAQEEVGMATADVLAAQGAFGTTIAGNIDERIDKSVNAAPTISGTRTDTTRLAVEAKSTWPTGTETGVAYSNSRKQVTGSLFIAPLQYESVVSFNVRQPLLRNGGGVADRRFVAQAREALKAADLTVQRRVQEALRTGLGDYWQEVFALREVQIAHEAVAAARAFLVITDERYRLGRAEGTDLLAAKANVASREATLLGAKTAVEAALQGLKTELQIPPGDSVTPVTKTPPARRPLPSEEGAIASGLANRPDYLAMQHRTEQLHLQLQMAQNKRWPSLDLISSLALNQMSTTSYGNAMSGMNNPNVFVGVQFQTPLENRQARGARDRAAHEKARALIDLKALENQIVHEIAERRQTLLLISNQVGAQEHAEAMQHNRLALEQEQYQLGRSSSLEVIRAQDDYLAARLATLRARQSYQSAWLDYQLATAQLP